MIIRNVFLLLFVLLAAGCNKSIKPEELAPGINPGKVYYTKFSFFEEKNHFRTTNYRKGRLVPINTPVRLISIDKKDIVVQVIDTNQTITIDNAEKHTHDDVQQAFKKHLGEQKTDLRQFTKEEQQNILEGTVKKGMRRAAVLAALGYPPVSATPSLKLNEWIYWSSVVNRFVVRFKDDKVAAIVD